MLEIDIEILLEKDKEMFKENLKNELKKIMFGGTEIKRSAF